MTESLKQLKEDSQYMRGVLGHYLNLDLKTVYHLASMPSTTIDMMKAFVKRYKFNHQEVGDILSIVVG